MKYVFYVYDLNCGHALNTDSVLMVGAHVYCPECQAMTWVMSVEKHSQDIDDVEELPG